MERKYCFGVTHTGPAILARLRESLESQGFVCTDTVEFLGHHQFELHTLIAVEPKKLHPIKFTRAGE